MLFHQFKKKQKTDIYISIIYKVQLQILVSNNTLMPDASASIRHIYYELNVVVSTCDRDM